MSTPFVLGHLSDLHIGEPGSVMDATFGGAERLSRTLSAMQHDPFRIDALLITGDLVDHATRSEYRRLRSLLENVTVPIVVLPGNHDDPDLLDVELNGVVAPNRVENRLGFIHDEWPLRIVALDTTVSGLHSGNISTERVEWVDAALGASTRPTVLALHHPPISTGMWWMDYTGPPGADLLEPVVARHPHVQVMCCGHIHRSLTTTFGGTLVSVASSMVYQSLPATSADALPLIRSEHSSFSLLRWDGERVTVSSQSVGAGDPIDLRNVIAPWAPYEEAARSGAPMQADHD